ncbi:MAG TPA: hypothetical protein VF582_03760 [Allosphingosinicella sp.]|jgi:hypothetical protein
MPFDDTKFNKPSTQGDVAGVAIECLAGFMEIKAALEKLQAGEDAKAHTEALVKIMQRLDSYFNELTGWTSTK